MAGAQVRKIKLISMEIADFKTLRKGTISWDFSPDGHFGIIAVQDFVDRSIMFEAFQFGFGHDTDAPNAEVMVVLQRQLDSHVETLKFKHSKKTQRLQTVTKFWVQTTGIDDDFQDVDQEQYFKELADHKIFASNQVFLMKGNSQEVLASDALDLRPFLEMYLFDKPHSDPNYDRTDERVQTLFAQKKEMKLILNEIEKNRENYELESIDKKNSFKAVSSEKEALLLQMFYHLKRSEEDYGELKDEPEYEMGRLMNELRRLDGDIDEKSLRYQMQNRSEANISSWNKFVKAKQNEIERQLESINSNIATLTSASSDVLNRFATAYGECKSVVLEAEIKAENARFKLEKAELELKISEITEEWENFQKITEEMTEEKNGTILIGIKAIEKHDKSIYLDDLKNHVADLIEQDNLFHGQHQFGVPEMPEENFREFMTKLPKSGQIVLHTIHKMDHTIANVLKDDEMFGDRFIMVHFKDPNSNLKLNPFLTGTTVTGKQDPYAFDKVPDTAELQEKLDEFEKYDNRGLRELVRKIEKKEYIVPKVLENNANVVQTGDQIENLKKELIDAQRELGTLYQTRFGAISQDLGFPSADSAANFCNAFAHLGVSTNQNFNDVIDDFTAMKNQLQHQRQQLQQHIAEILPSQGTRIDLMTWEKLLVHGKQIAKSVEEFSEYVNEFFYLEFQKAKIANVASAVKYVNELLRINALVKDWDLPFKTEEVHSTDTYLDCISEQNKQDFNADDMSISKAFEIVGTHVMNIKQAITKFKHKNGRIHGNNAKLRALQQKLKRAQTTIRKIMVAPKREFVVRVNAFTEKFEQFFLPSFKSLVNICSRHWQMSLSLDYSTALSPLREPILFLVSDPTLDHSYNEMTALSHHAAAIILKLAINLTIGSPILIFDSIDYIVEERLKNPIMKLLEKLVNDHGIQVFFMMVKSQKDLPTGNVHQIWSQMNQRSGIMEDLIADITALSHRSAQ